MHNLSSGFIRSFLLLAAVLSVLATSCRQESQHDAGHARPLPQRIYVWQRDWTAAVGTSLQEGREALSGCVVLATEVEWRNGQPRAVRPDVDWLALRAWGKPVSAALRIAPYPGPFAEDGDTVRQLCALARGMVAEAKAHGVALAELQVDFDCAQKKLAGYRLWVRQLRDAIAPLRMVLTTLPAWLGEREFPALVREVPGYVLQVHSIASPLGDARTMICDPALARRWVAMAERIGHVFEIALPTYRSVVGYDAAGQLLGVASDGVRPSWPAGTVVREYATDAEAMADLIAEWSQKQPRHCQGLLWYRLPVSSDVSNWTWPTLRAVMAGRVPKQTWLVRMQGENPVDLTLRNDGESPGPWQGRVEVRWASPTRVVAEALRGWEVSLEGQRAVFSPASGKDVPLPPGSERAIGWLRLEPAVPVHAQTIP
ncbi:MAG: DUF3142 domain-containing protein [Roseimicrobium sp.]